MESKSGVFVLLLWRDIILKTKFETEAKYRTKSGKMFLLNAWETVKKKKEASISVLMGILSRMKNKGLVREIMRVHLLCRFSHSLSISIHNTQKRKRTYFWAMEILQF